MNATVDFKALQDALIEAEKTPSGPTSREELMQMNPFLMEQIIAPLEAGKELLMYDVDYSKFTREEMKAVLRVMTGFHPEQHVLWELVKSAKRAVAATISKPTFL